MCNWKGNWVSWEEEGRLISSCHCCLPFSLSYLSFFQLTHFSSFLSLSVSFRHWSFLGRPPSSPAILLPRRKGERVRSLTPFGKNGEGDRVLWCSWCQSTGLWGGDSQGLLCQGSVTSSSTVQHHKCTDVGFVVDLIILSLIFHMNWNKLALEVKSASSWWNSLPSLKNLSNPCIQAINLWLYTFCVLDLRLASLAK